MHGELVVGALADRRWDGWWVQKDVAAACVRADLRAHEPWNGGTAAPGHQVNLGAMAVLHHQGLAVSVAVTI
jgi:hypothetical protein